MEGLAVHETVVAGPSAGAQLYAPSWIDRLNRHISTLPGHGWPAYLLVWIVLYSLLTLLHWASLTYPAGTFYALHGVLAGMGVFFLAVVRYLDRTAERSIEAFRPALATDEATYQDLRYRLTTMPARQVLLVNLSLLPLPFVVIAFLWLTGRADVLDFGTNPYAVAFELSLFVMGIFSVSGFLCHTFRQYTLVRQIYAQYTRIDLFHTEPLHAFSRLTAHTSIAVTIAAYGWLLAVPNTQRVPEAIVLVALYTLGAGAIFVVPLLGIHSMLVKEKGRLKASASAYLEAALSELHRRIGSLELDTMVNLQAGIDTLLKERDALDRISTWPWETETVRFLGTALLLPFALWILQRVLDTLLRF